ncbi:uncharacterized protein LOC121556694 isoform X4 [Coregonus clupeaformis]|uniref:uncharacterized protein LOC121556694 isoform X4 n=1 Tax=Coregonus clupeaformis TaxID=59861 RepID=UPI001E1C65C0|nr:uncharacterized protein LOC121556694 isoform X4 [Coregonus clupeaformis]
MQLPVKMGHQNNHTKVGTEHNKECLINISKYKFSLVISGLTNVLKNVNNMQIFGEAAEKNLYLSQLIILDTLEKCLVSQSKDCLRLDETTLVKQLLPEICHFIHTYREGHQHAAELRASASGVLFSLSCNNFNAVFSRISTRLQELTVCSEDTVDVHDIELMQYINVDCSKLKRMLQVVQREEGDPQREGQEVVEEEPVAPPKKEAKKERKAKRKSSGKKSGKQGTNNDAVSGRSSPIASGTQAAEQMVNMVQKCFDDHATPEDQSSTSELVSCIPPATEEVMTVIADMVDELEKEDPELAKVLREVAVKVKMLASGSDLAVEHLDAQDSPVPEELNIICTSCNKMTQSLGTLFGAKFKTKASKAVSEILVRRFRSGISGMVQPSHSFSTTPSLTNASGPSDRILDSAATGLIQTKVDSEASQIIDNFVEDVKDIVQHAELDQPTSTQRDPQVGHCITKRKPFHVARRLCDRLQAKLNTLFLTMGGTPVQGKELMEKVDSSDVLLEHTDSSDLPVSILSLPSPCRSESPISECNSSSLSDGRDSTGSVEEKTPEQPETCKSEAILQEVNSIGLGALRKCQSENSQPLLSLCDSNLVPCTKEVLSQIVDIYRSDQECTSSVAESFFYNSLEVYDFLDGVMSYLEDMPVSGSSALEGLRDPRI